MMPTLQTLCIRDKRWSGQLGQRVYKKYLTVKWMWPQNKIATGTTIRHFLFKGINTPSVKRRVERQQQGPIGIHCDA